MAAHSGKHYPEIYDSIIKLTAFYPLTILLFPFDVLPVSYKSSPLSQCKQAFDSP